MKTLPIFLLCIALFSCYRGKEPPRKIPENLYNEYTFNKTIPVHKWYFDNSHDPATVFREKEINEGIEKAKQRQEGYYGATDRYLYASLDKHLKEIKGNTIGIIGSTLPWYESIVLSYEKHPVSIDYNKIDNTDPRIEVMTVAEYQDNPVQFDAILCISSIEHDGLGRYGDPINPQGDLQTMQKLKGMLKAGGLLFLAIPVGEDSIYWNAHRVYGKLRLPLLFNGWEVVDSSGFNESDLSVKGYTGHQPVFVLRPIF